MPPKTNNPNPPGWPARRAPTVPSADIDTRARVQLKPDQFDRLIKQQGVRVKIYRSLLCPNVKSIDGAEHDIDCGICRSNGFLDVRPVETMAFIQGQTMETQNTSSGFIDGNTVAATFLAGANLQYFSKIEIPDHTDTFNERIKRSLGRVDRLKYQAVVIDVVVDSEAREYFPGIDFNLTPTGDIGWLPGRGPESGVIYSIYYTIVLQFRAIRAMHNNRFGQVVDKAQIQMVKLPEQWSLEKIYLADRRDASGNPLSPNPIKDPDDAVREVQED